MNEAPAPGRDAAGKARQWAFDTRLANHARVYDYLLGGKDNYAADRAAAEAALKVWPGLAFHRAGEPGVSRPRGPLLAGEVGMRQFLDIGTGISTAGNTHEVAQSVAPEARMVYVDYDPIVLGHARALLTSSKAGVTGYIEADLRDTGTIIA